MFISREKLWGRGGWPGIVLLILVLGITAGCDDLGSDRRATHAAKETGEIVVGIVWGDLFEGLFVEGATLARDQINNKGGILGRPLRFEIVNAAGDATTPARSGLEIAQSLAAHPDLIAVLGHSAAEGAISASIAYEREGILMISPAVTDRAFNEHGFQHVFSTIPDEAQIAAQVATFGFGLGYRRIAILNSREDWADQNTKGFIQHAVTLGMTIVTRRSFFRKRTNFRDILADFGAFQFDALYIAAAGEEATQIVKQSQEMNLDVPILLADFQDPVALRTVLGRETPRITAPALFNRLSDRLAVRSFVREFRKGYGVEPDDWAAQGYDSVRMLARAIEDARAPVPLSVATILRYTLAWRGVTGRHSFDRGGRIYTKVLDFSTLENGRIEFHSPDGSVVEYKDAGA